MNLIKSLFISSYMMLATGITGYAVWMVLQGGAVIAWEGVMLTTAPFLILLGRLMLFKRIARTSARFPLLNLLGGIGAGLAVLAWYGNVATGLAPVLALAGWAGFLLYAYWYSDNGRQPSKSIAVGTALPVFTLKGIDGRPVTSAQLTDRPAILMFYRGNWCPLCMAQIRELVERYKDLDALGVRVALISPQPHGNTEALARKFDVRFDFLTDEGNRAARQLGIEQENGLPAGMQMLGYDSETVLPTVIITDRGGRIVWTDETDNYRVRPEPDIYLEILRKTRVLNTA